MGSLRNYQMFPSRAGNISLGWDLLAASEWGTRGIHSEISGSRIKSEDKKIASTWENLRVAVYTARHENEFPLTGFSAINQLNRVRVRRGPRRG